MTLQEVTDVASILIGKQVDISLAKIYLTEGLRLMFAKYDTACPIKCLSVECAETDTPYPLPKHRGIYKIYRDKHRYFDYQCDERGLSFSEPGSYLVYYYSVFSGELAVEESIPVAPEYDSELCKYVAFSVLRADDPANRLADTLIEEFHGNCTAIHESIAKRQRKRPTPIETPGWR